MEEIANTLQGCIDLLKKVSDNKRNYNLIKRPGKISTLKQTLKAVIGTILDEEFFERYSCDSICCTKWYDSGQLFPPECCKTCIWFNKPKYEELLKEYNNTTQLEFDFGDDDNEQTYCNGR